MESGQITRQLLAVSSSHTHLYIEIYYKKLFPDKLDHPVKIYFKRTWMKSLTRHFPKMILLRRSLIDQWFGFTKMICSPIFVPIVNYRALHILLIKNRAPFSHSTLHNRSPQSHFVTSTYLIKHLVFHPPNNKVFQYHLLLSHLHHSFFNSPSCYEPINHHLPQTCQRWNFYHWAY